MQVWWEPFAAAFHPLAKCMKQNKIEPFPMASLCILHTSSNLQLGKLWYMILRFWDMPKEGKKAVQARTTQG